MMSDRSGHHIKIGAQELTRRMGGEWHRSGYGMVSCPCHPDDDPSLKILETPNMSYGVVVHCFGCDTPWQTIKDKIASQGYFGSSPPPPARPLRRGAYSHRPASGSHANKPGNGPTPTEVYVYEDAQGDPWFRTERYEYEIEGKKKKEFLASHPDGNGGWESGVGDRCRILYRLPELQEAVALNQVVFIVEGERKCDALRALNIPATTAPFGASAPWKHNYSETLQGACVVILPDNNTAGHKHATKVVAGLCGLPKEVKVLNIPGLKVGEDVHDWLKRGGTAEQLWDLVDTIAADVTNGEYVPPPTEDKVEHGADNGPGKSESKTDGNGTGEHAAEVERLAKLSPFEYDRVRVVEAKRLGIRLLTLDEEVRKLRAAARGETFNEDKLPPEPDPWEDRVDGAALLDEVTQTFVDHLVLPKHAAEGLALWTLHAHAHDCFDISPILTVTSPAPECGKTTTLKVLGRLVPRKVSAANITAATVYRCIAKWHPTLLIDEGDTFIHDRDELRGVLNSGHEREGAFVVRCEGDNHDAKRFSTWAPKAVALIGKLPATLASRSIHIALRRKGPTEKVKRLRLKHFDDFVPLKSQMVRWAKDNAAELRNADPKVPENLYSRVGDNWEPLLAIADLAGGEWPAKSRQVATALSGSSLSDTDSILLLGDIRSIFNARKSETNKEESPRLPSLTICEDLAAMETRPWPEMPKNQKPITQRQLAALLDPFGVAPKTIKLKNERTPKGYLLEQFQDIFNRYLPPEPPFGSATAPPPLETHEFSANSSATEEDPVADKKPKKPRETNAGGGVADKNPPPGGEHSFEGENDLYDMEF